MTALALAGVSIRRMLRDRTSMFFVVLLPVAIILIIGVTIGGQNELKVGVVDGDRGPQAVRLVDRLGRSAALTVHRYADADAALVGLRRAEIDAAVLVPRGYDDALRAGRAVRVPVVTEQANTGAFAATAAVSAVVAAEGARVQAAHFAAARTGVSYDRALALATDAQQRAAPVPVQVVSAGGETDYLPLGFGYSAPTMLVLFVFVNALAGGAAIIQTRRLGVYDRALAAPVRTRSIVAGETLAALALALLQSALIVGVGALVFGVSWGDPVAAVALTVVWALVGTGAGVLSGSLFRTPEQASSIGPAIGIAFGMLGGCMWPLEIVPSALRTVGHVVPQGWAIDAWTELLSRGGTLVDIARPLAVLAAFAATLLVLATWLLRRRLTA